MSRLPPLTPDRLDADQRAVYDGITEGPRGAALTQEDGSLAGPFNALLYSPGIGAPAEKLGAAVRFSSSLPDDLRELAILITAREWGARFEWWAHARLARQAGIPDAVIDALRDRRDPPLEGEAHEAVYAFCRELLDTRNVGDATYQRLVAAVGERGAVDLVVLSGYYGLVSMILNTFEVPLPPGVDDPLEEK